MYTSALLALLPLAAAQYGGGYGSGSSTTAATPSTTPTASGATVHKVDVGNGGLIFNPNSVTAAVGDMVEFTFYPMNHSIAQSSFSAPCVPLSSGMGLFSGFQFATKSGAAVSLPSHSKDKQKTDAPSYSPRHT